MTLPSGERLATAISALMTQFKVEPAGTAYEDLSLTDAAVIAWLTEAAAEQKQPIQKEVADSLGLPKTTMTSAVKRLCAKGLIEQIQGLSDARARRLRLTDQGHGLGSALSHARIEASVAMLDRLPVDDQAKFISLLETIVAGGRPAGDRST